MEFESTLLIAIVEAATSPPTDYAIQQGWVVIAFQNAFWQLPHAANLEEVL